jgi:hypothetical protein
MICILDNKSDLIGKKINLKKNVSLELLIGLDSTLMNM